MLRLLIPALAILLLAACGGGSGDPTPTPHRTTPPPPTARPIAASEAEAAALGQISGWADSRIYHAHKWQEAGFHPSCEAADRVERGWIVECAMEAPELRDDSGDITQSAATVEQWVIFRIGDRGGIEEISWEPPTDFEEWASGE